MMNFIKRNMVELTTDAVLLVTLITEIVYTGYKVQWHWTVNEYLGMSIGWLIATPFAHKILKKEMEKNLKKK